MSLRLPNPVLAVNAGKFSQVDTMNAENFCGMWMVFLKCAESIEEGRRLENLSRRLWNREISRNKGKENHVTSSKLQELVSNIIERKGLHPLSPSIISSTHLVSDITAQLSSPGAAPAQDKHSTQSCATTVNDGASEIISVAGSEPRVPSAEPQSPEIVRGFLIGPESSSSYKSQSRLTLVPAPSTSIHHKPGPLKKRPGIFTLGDGSSGEDKSSFEDSFCHGQKSSSLSGGNVVESRTIRPIRGTVHEDNDAIEDDDDLSDWEDSVSQSARSSPVDDKQLFQRSRSNLTSQRSLLTTALHEPQSAAALAAAGSRSIPVFQRSRISSPNGPSVASSPNDDGSSALTMRRPNTPYSKSITMNTTNTHPPVPSPRTTRRHMLETELTESLRKHLLWERQQKSTTANAVFKRRHPAIDVTKLQDYPGQKTS